MQVLVFIFNNYRNYKKKKKKNAKTARNKKKKQNKIFMLARNKFNSIENKISKELINNEISHKDFMTIIIKKKTIEN